MGHINASLMKRPNVNPKCPGIAYLFISISVRFSFVIDRSRIEACFFVFKFKMDAKMNMRKLSKYKSTYLIRK